MPGREGRRDMHASRCAVPGPIRRYAGFCHAGARAPACGLQPGAAHVVRPAQGGRSAQEVFMQLHRKLAQVQSDAHLVFWFARSRRTLR